MKRNVKKWIALGASLLLALVALMGCNSAAPAAESAEATQRVESFTLKLGFDAEFPPYGYRDESGEYVGFDIDMAKTLCARLGWELELIPIDWDSKDFELDAGTIDCIWNGFTMNDREELYTWTDAYMDNSQVFITRTADGIADFAGLAGKVVSVQKESSALTALNEEENAELLASFASLEQCADYNTAFMELESGAIDAIAMDIGVARFQMEGRGDTFTILDQPLQAEQYGVGFKLGNTELRDQVQAELISMVADGTFAEISNNWFGYDVCILGK